MINGDRNIDLKTGFKTRNILAQPVRRNRGGGNIIAVVEMMNKADNQDFSEDDEQILTACCENVAEVLSNRFQELMNAGERFSGDFFDLIPMEERYIHITIHINDRECDLHPGEDQLCLESEHSRSHRRRRIVSGDRRRRPWTWQSQIQIALVQSRLLFFQNED